MKYYSEILDRKYDALDELEKDEKVYLEEKEKKEKERASRVKEVEEAFKTARKAEKNANKLFSKFCEDYGTFHTSIEETFSSFYTLFDFIFN